jgi:hypothetical protein
MSDEQVLSETLMQAIARDKFACGGLTRLSSADATALKQILKGDYRSAVAIDLKRALTALAYSDRSLETTEILSRVLSDKNETIGTRVAAASQLAMMLHEAAEQALIENLDTTNEVLQSEIVKSLAHVGTARSLDSLDRIQAPKSDYLKKQLALARFAIASRSATHRETTRGKNPLAPRWTTQSASKLEESRVRERIAAIHGSTFGVSLNPAVGFEVDFRGPRFTLLLNENLKSGAFVNSLMSRQMIAGLVVAENPGFRHLTTRYLILTNPAEDQVEVTVIRTNGDVSYAGHARREGSELRLNIRDIGQRLTTAIEGRLNNEMIQWDARLLLTEPKPKKQPLSLGANLTSVTIF